MHITTFPLAHLLSLASAQLHVYILMIHIQLLTHMFLVSVIIMTTYWALPSNQSFFTGKLPATVREMGVSDGGVGG